MATRDGLAGLPEADVLAFATSAADVLLMTNPGATPETDTADLLPPVQLYLHGTGRRRRRRRPDRVSRATAR